MSESEGKPELYWEESAQAFLWDPDREKCRPLQKVLYCSRGGPGRASWLTESWELWAASIPFVRAHLGSNLQDVAKQGEMRTIFAPLVLETSRTSTGRVWMGRTYSRDLGLGPIGRTPTFKHTYQPRRHAEGIWRMKRISCPGPGGGWKGDLFWWNRKGLDWPTCIML